MRGPRNCTNLHQGLRGAVTMAAVAVGVAAAQWRVVGPLARAKELARHKFDRVGEQRCGRRNDRGPREVGPAQAGVLLAICT